MLIYVLDFFAEHVDKIKKEIIDSIFKSIILSLDIKKISFASIFYHAKLTNQNFSQADKFQKKKLLRWKETKMS